MLAYLAGENAYTDAMMAHTKPEQELLFQELLGRVKQDDSTVPARKNGYWYYKRFEEGKEYPIYARRKGSPTAPEQVILDGNALAAGHSFFQIGGTEVTRDGKLLAYGEDVVGRRQYVLKFKDLETGATLADAIPGVSPSFAWANDGRTLLYVETTRSPCWATGCASTCSAPIRRAIRRCTRRRTTRSTSSCRRARATASWSSRCRARCPPSGGWRAPTIRSSPSMSSCRASATTSTRPRISAATGSCAPTGRRRTSASCACRWRGSPTAAPGATSCRRARTRSSRTSLSSRTISPSASARGACSESASSAGATARSR